MANYQLMRTLIPLSGQCEWAIDIDKNSISNFRIKPISEYIDFIDSRDCIQHEHQYNLKNLYESTSDTFFESILKPELRGWAPILTDHQIDTHESTYEYGCERVSFSKYGKTFKMLIPLWLDDLKDVYNINIQLIGKSTNNHRTSNKNINAFDDRIKDGLTVDPATTIFRFGINLDRYDRSDTLEGKLSRYFWNWIDYINPNKEYDNFLYMSFAKQKANIAGVDCVGGVPIVKSVDSLIENLTSRERPLMEQNHLMTSQWADNNMICNQLFNFAIYFNIDDLTDIDIDMVPLNFSSEVYISKQNASLRTEQTLNAELNTYVSEKYKLEQSDFLFNYDFIRKTHVEYAKYKSEYLFNTYGNVESQGKNLLVTNSASSNENIYDYMSDNRFVDFMKSNKLVPVDVFMKQINQSNPFVLYDGFAPMVGYNTGDGDNIALLQHATSIIDNETNIIDDVWTTLNNSDRWLKWVLCPNTITNEVVSDYKYRSQELDPTSGYGNIFEWQGIKLYKNKFDKIQYKYMYGIMEKICDDTPEKILSGSEEDRYVCPYSFDIGTDTIVVRVYIGPKQNVSSSACSGDDVMSLITFAKFKEFINILYDAIKKPSAQYNINTVHVSGKEPNISMTTKYLTVNGSTLSDFFKGQQQAIEFLHALVNATIPSTVIFFNKTVEPVEIERPTFADEISYNKVNNYYKYLIRCDGKMIPFFFNDSSRYYNNIYQFKKLYDIERSDYFKNIKTKFTPIYPSVEYYPLDRLALKFTNVDYVDIYKAKNDYNSKYATYLSNSDTCYYNFYPRHINESNFNLDDRFEDNLGELKWYNDSLLYVLPKYIEIEIPYKKQITVLQSTNELEQNKYGDVIDVEKLTNTIISVDNVPNISHLAEYLIKEMIPDKEYEGKYKDRLDYFTHVLTNEDIKNIIEKYIIDKYNFSYTIQEKNTPVGQVIIYKVLYTLK